MSREERGGGEKSCMENGGRRGEGKSWRWREANTLKRIPAIDYLSSPARRRTRRDSPEAGAEEIMVMMIGTAAGGGPEDGTPFGISYPCTFI